VNDTMTATVVPHAVPPSATAARLTGRAAGSAPCTCSTTTSTGDRIPGLRTAEDGSVTISMQASAPGPDKDSNWLPAPAGRFRPILRMYQPQKAILDGSYVLPPVRKVG